MAQSVQERVEDAPGTYRPEARQRGQSRQALLDAASALMREMDTVDVSITDIAERAGVNHAMVRYHFGSKEGLLFALLDRDIGTGVVQVGKLLKRDITPTEMMRMHLSRLVDSYYRTPYLHRLIQKMVRNAEPDRVRYIADKLLRPIVSAQEIIIRAGVAAGEFRPVDPKLFYFNSMGAADVLYSNRFSMEAVFGDAPEVLAELHRRNREQTVEILLRGIAA